MSPRRTPRAAADAIRAVLEQATPATLLGSVQASWEDAVGARIAAQAEPVSEREGVVTVACRTAAWAHELDLIQEEILARLNASIATATDASVKKLRTTADLSRFDT